MKIAFLFLLALPAMAQLFPFPGPGSQLCTPGYVFVGHGDGGGPNGATTASANTSGVSLIVIAASWFSGGGALTISDSKSNSYTALTIQTVGGSVSSRLFYKANPIVGSGHTFTVAGTGTFSALNVIYFSGCTSGFDTGIETGATASSVTSRTTGSITPSVNNAVVISGLSLSNLGTGATADSGMSSFFLPFTAATNEGVGVAYKIQTSAAPINPTWSWTGAVDAAATIASFKP